MRIGDIPSGQRSGQRIIANNDEDKWHLWGQMIMRTNDEDKWWQGQTMMRRWWGQITIRTNNDKRNKKVLWPSVDPSILSQYER